MTIKLVIFEQGFGRSCGARLGTPLLLLFLVFQLLPLLPPRVVELDHVPFKLESGLGGERRFSGARSAESCIRKAVAEHDLTPGLVGLADPTAEDEAASRWADFALPLGIEWHDPRPRDAPGGHFGPPEGVRMRAGREGEAFRRGRDPGSPHPAGRGR